MYDLYKRNCRENESSFVKSFYYWFILNTCFNIRFHLPKTDRHECSDEMKIKRKEEINIMNELHDAQFAEQDSPRRTKGEWQKCDPRKWVNYCFWFWFSIWVELTSGSPGNDIASAFNATLGKIIADNLSKTDFICWLYSWFPQNRNSHISQAILEFLPRTRSMK